MLLQNNTTPESWHLLIPIGLLLLSAIAFKYLIVIAKTRVKDNEPVLWWCWILYPLLSVILIPVFFLLHNLWILLPFFEDSKWLDKMLRLLTTKPVKWFLLGIGFFITGFTIIICIVGAVGMIIMKVKNGQ